MRDLTTSVFLNIMLIINYLGLMFFANRASQVNQFGFIIIITVLSVLALTGTLFAKREAYITLSLIFILIGFDLIYLFFIAGFGWLRLIFGLFILFFTFIGFVISFFKQVEYKDEKEEQEIQVPVYKEDEVNQKVEAAKTEFSPGKYVASKTGKKYHVPKCDWAKKIKENKQVWFNSKDEVKNYTACNCVK